MHGGSFIELATMWITLLKVLLITVIYDLNQNLVDLDYPQSSVPLSYSPRQTTAVPFSYGDVHTPLSKEQQWQIN
jgi:hypothetical protein